MPIDALPSELLEAILEALWRDLDELPHMKERKRTELSRCSLVCKFWCAPARKLLFRDIVYSFRRVPGGGLARWEALHHDTDGRWGTRLNEPETVPYKTLEMFVAFLRTVPDVARAVQRLTLRCYPSEWQRSWGAPQAIFSERDRVDPALLASLLHALPNLTQLTTHTVVPAHPRAFAHPTLKALTILYEAMVPESGDPEVVLRCFPMVTELVLRDGGRDTGRWPALAAVGRPPLALHSLRLIELSFLPPGLRGMLTASGTVHALRSLWLERIQETALPAVQVLLNAVGPSLHCIRYYIETYDDLNAVDDHQAIDFTPCRALQKLTVSAEGVLDFHLERWDSALGAVTSIFTAMTASPGIAYPELKEVTVELLLEVVDPNMNPQRRYRQASALDEALNVLVECSSVRKVTVRYVGDPDLEDEGEGRTLVEAILPKLHRLGRLEIE